MSFDEDGDIEWLGRERPIELGEAVNELIRGGLRAQVANEPFRQRTTSLGLRVDVTKVAETLGTGRPGGPVMIVDTCRPLDEASRGVPTRDESDEKGAP